MTVFFLIRHALHSFGGEAIAGRTPEVHLSPQGQEQAIQLGERLSRVSFEAIYSSPMERTQETAVAIAARQNVAVQVRPEINELDFGDWMGQRLDDLRPQETWKQFNSFRSGTRAPNGELMLETQNRIVSFMQGLRAQHSSGNVALVSHADVIKSAVAYYMGVPLDLFSRIEISPASVSVIVVTDYGPWILGLNHTGDLPQLPD
ncbi:MAG TPA: histidine phosphatase family protein [Abditibacteriaceae bacterium]|jgi:probable phosphoglycerate mutase|nr:histidine phosphatase family protein [Abditibacteriaceae bacterium]